MTPAPAPALVVLVTGLSGAGKASILAALEDCGFETVDNPPLPLLPELAGRAGPRLAMGVDARSRGFDAQAVLAALERLRQQDDRRVELVYATAEEDVLLRRYTETRRRHPLAPAGRVVDGIAAEIALTAPLKVAADLVVDTSDLPLRGLRTLIERRYGRPDQPMAIGLVSFAYPRGLPREADLVFDLRWLRNPHDDPDLRPLTGLDPAVAAHVAADPDFPEFFARMAGLVDVLLPRFVAEGKKYATIALGCTGGRHRSVATVQKLAAHLGSNGWRVDVTHRELARMPPAGAEPVRQAQEA
jgi:UPF0042 nucleotide-binding protein